MPVCFTFSRFSPQNSLNFGYSSAQDLFKYDIQNFPSTDSADRPERQHTHMHTRAFANRFTEREREGEREKDREREGVREREREREGERKKERE